MSATVLSPLVVSPSDGKPILLGGVQHLFKLTAEETGGAFSLMEASIEPGRLIPPHVHTREDELFYPLEGELGIRIGDQEYQLGPGSCVFAPRGIPHAVWNAGTRPSRGLAFISPGGLEKYFEEMAAALHQGGPPDVARLMEINHRYGLTNVMEWVPELTAKYHLKLLGQP
jgi:quercetin dioxygenase-like cupin family protein